MINAGGGRRENRRRFSIVGECDGAHAAQRPRLHCAQSQIIGEIIGACGAAFRGRRSRDGFDERRQLKERVGSLLLARPVDAFIVVPLVVNVLVVVAITEIGLVVRIVPPGHFERSGVCATAAAAAADAVLAAAMTRRERGWFARSHTAILKQQPVAHGKNEGCERRDSLMDSK